MYIEKKEDLSLHYWLVDLFQDAPFITLVDEFPEELLKIPTISSDVGRIEIEDLELGDREGIRIRNWYIDIFAKTKTQREDFGYRILNALKDGINVYDYDEGFPPNVTPSKIGHLNVLARSYEPMKVSPDFTDKLYYRTTINIVTVNDKL
jgi:hypothetical protein